MIVTEPVLQSGTVTDCSQWIETVFLPFMKLFGHLCLLFVTHLQSVIGDGLTRCLFNDTWVFKKGQY